MLTTQKKRLSSTSPKTFKNTTTSKILTGSFVSTRCCLVLWRWHFLTKGDKDVYSCIRQEKPSDFLISQSQLSKFLSKKPFIRSFLHKNGYKTSEISGKQDIELYLGCLMGYITEKDKRCLDSIILQGSLHHKTKENLELVLQKLYSFLKVKVNPVFLIRRNLTSDISSRKWRFLMIFGVNSWSLLTGRALSFTVLQKSSSPLQVGKCSLLNNNFT